MPEISQYQNVFRVAKRDATSRGTHTKVKKRNRQSVSCMPCRTRKSKCDRKVPCQSCSKRGESESCDYSSDDVAGRSNGERLSRDSEAQARLQKLEAMVTSLISAQTESSTNPGAKESFPGAPKDSNTLEQPPNDSSQSSEATPKGHLQSHGSVANYVGPTHWATILENIRGIQGLLDTDAGNDDEVPVDRFAGGPDLVIDTTQPLTAHDICKSLPPRPAVDKLLSVYFNAKQLQFLPLIHCEKFLREYEMFWQNPNSTSFLWISMLFSILHLGSQFCQPNPSNLCCGSPPDDPAGATFLKRAGDSLVAGEYKQAKPYSIEALLLYAAACRYTQDNPLDNDVWILIGITARLAMKMGYHRDPRHFPNITPFEGEMRRRAFFFVETFELLLSYQAGLPAIIHEEECDVEPPRNLLDSDFDEDCKALPPSRPTTDPTPMLYYCTKGRLSKIFRRVLRHILSFTPCPYDDTLSLDRQLQEAYAEIPPSLKMKSLGSSFTDPAYMILNRRNLETLHLKVVCILHRNYLTHERSNPAFRHSRKTCTDAALRLLDLQAELYTACQPGGQLFDHSWMMASINMQDFLLAAMVISLDLHESAKEAVVEDGQGKAMQVKQYDALRFAYIIWAKRKTSSRDASRAVSILEAIFARIPNPSGGARQPVMPQAAATVTGETFDIAASISGLSTWDTPDLLSQDFSSDNLGTLHPEFVDSMDAAFGASDNFDWSLIDQDLLGRTNDGDLQLDWQSA